MHQINTKISKNSNSGWAQAPPQTPPPFGENKPTFYFASLFLNPGYESGRDKDLNWGPPGSVKSTLLQGHCSSITTLSNLDALAINYTIHKILIWLHHYNDQSPHTRVKLMVVGVRPPWSSVLVFQNTPFGSAKLGLGRSILDNLQQGYSKCGPRSRIQTTKGSQWTAKDHQLVLTMKKSRVRGPRKFWKFGYVDPGTKSLSTPDWQLNNSNISHFPGKYQNTTPPEKCDPPWKKSSIFTLPHICNVCNDIKKMNFNFQTNLEIREININIQML